MSRYDAITITITLALAAIMLVLLFTSGCGGVNDAGTSRSRLWDETLLNERRIDELSQEVSDLKEAEAKRLIDDRMVELSRKGNPTDPCVPSLLPDPYAIRPAPDGLTLAETIEWYRAHRGTSAV